MPINSTVRGQHAGETLEVDIVLSGAELVGGDKWTLNCGGTPAFPMSPSEHEVPAGANTPTTMTWKSVSPLQAGIAGRQVKLELRKVHGTGAGLTPVHTFTVDIQPAAPAPAPAPPPPAVPPARPATPPAATVAPGTIPNPLPVTIVGGGSVLKSIFNGANLVLLMSIAGAAMLLWFAWHLVNLAGSTYFAPAAVPTVPAGQSVIVTTVEQRVVTDDPTVALEAAKASAEIKHTP